MEDFPRNCWYVAAWSREIGDQAVLDRTVLGHRLAIYRTSAGEVIALRNRCPHRSAPLSLGTREGDDLRCGYHGMRFGPNGRCLEIPGQDTIPPSACVATYPAAERGGWVWVWLGTPDLADTASLPNMCPMGDAEWRMRTGYLHYAANAKLVHDNLLDFSHLQFVHRNTFGGGANWATKPEISRLPDGFRIERWLPDIPPPPIFRERLPEGARLDLLNVYEFVSPGVLSVSTVMQPAGAAPREQLAADGTSGNLSVQAVTPETASSAHYFFSIGLPADESEASLDQLLEGTLAAFEEDRAMIEAQQEQLLSEPDEPIARTALEADAPINRMRALLHKKARSERDGMVNM